VMPRRTVHSWVFNSQSANTYRITRLFLSDTSCRTAVTSREPATGQARHVSELPEDSSEAVRPKVAGSIAETSDVRNFLGIYEIAVRCGGVQTCIVDLRRTSYKAARRDIRPSL